MPVVNGKAQHCIGLAALGYVLVFGGAAITFDPAPAMAFQERQDKTGTLKFEVYTDAAGEFRWRLRAANGSILATSGAGYKSKSDCREAVDRIKAEANTGKLKFEDYEDRGGEHRWRLKSANGQIVAASAEGYKAKADCEHAIESIKKGASKAEVQESTEAPGERFEIYKDRSGEHRWRLKGADEATLAMSSEGYKDKADCRKS